MSDIVAAIVLAAGRSTRMGGQDKLWADLDGASVIERALRGVADLPELDVLVIVAPLVLHERLASLVPEREGLEVRCVAGGTRRQDSVAAGLAAAQEANWVLVHDGARPLVTPELCARVLEAAREHGAAVPVVPVVDTLKRIDEDGRVLATIDRSTVRAAQTPQGFNAGRLRAAHAMAQADVTDDAAMIEADGGTVMVVDGDPANFKVTGPFDLALARALLAARVRGDG
ncbi:MAG: 2-C-methyl-D-erythritol 4-phosphate cytidylyltransferase [Chloroflexi bacterium]|nr:2-C-methyl-D-erythritol 4-phosphate cytidylyltransferase [Chloroflexota bacterium]MDA1146823.1 2-C-methyl-D-erythritol 4-phosphate cytidylyltransferase [Chloroflexota bacterium]MQC82437.1 2-C-methyl-D-erythritol 4-phosphate cytidylyltransferase [Chloroflexota bacterium]